jgi:hypothetical protein
MRFDPFALLVLGVAAISFYRAIQGYRTGTAHWYVRPEQGLSADKRDDPVGYSTAVWGNVTMGLSALFLAGWLLLR